jgi:hypothetical protein
MGACLSQLLVSLGVLGAERMMLKQRVASHIYSKWAIIILCTEVNSIDRNLRLGVLLHFAVDHGSAGTVRSSLTNDLGFVLLTMVEMNLLLHMLLCVFLDSLYLEREPLSESRLLKFRIVKPLS